MPRERIELYDMPCKRVVLHKDTNLDKLHLLQTKYQSQCVKPYNVAVRAAVVAAVAVMTNTRTWFSPCDY